MTVKNVTIPAIKAFCNLEPEEQALKLKYAVCRGDLDASESEFLNRLADLIEPEERTCRMTVLENARGNPKHFLMYVCSECHGAVVHDRYDPIYFCPNCGAKVVEE